MTASVSSPAVSLPASVARSGLSFGRRLRQVPLPVLIGGFVVLFWVITALTVSFWGLPDPIQIAGKRLQAPSLSHWLGTDALGRDVLSRTLYGAVYSVPIAIGVVAAGVFIGATLGAIAGYVGGDARAI